ncbi:radical SAM protein [Thiohalophilus thiocyanatoxydans]|uniref:Radical SAM family protein n=1 Tax=Thiohalophilus thiocyanatoxydans TaxID=381308 RepID=A0A4R8INC0_9GAMM|nr:radical SAM protein [Thiohalophilus thiocyanatoxydans]TDY00620.1 radical SAM family protein [Thiohalophilus thiocyanatoxydans]
MASVSGSAVEHKGTEGIAVVSGGGRVVGVADQAALLPVYLTTMRQRFKDEINRLTTGGAMRRMLDGHPRAAELAFPMAYLYAWHWLRHNVHDNYRAQVLETFRGPRFGFLMDLLLCDTAEQFVRGYVQHWLDHPAEGQKQWQEYQTLLAAREGNTGQLIEDILALWQGLGLFTQTYMAEFKNVAREERERYAGMLGAEDQERLALVDALPDDLQGVTPRFDKLGIIPAMGCPQTCRHCMFTWRPPRGKNEDPEQVLDLVDQHTDSVLFTGGDLTKQLDHFYAAIRRMRHIKNFALLLNGDFADTPEITHDVLGKMAQAIKSRPKKWAPARVLLQISFDEFHNEVYVDKQGLLAERIPVARIANIVECYPRYAEQIQLALLHKQTAMNFSQDVLQKGVFARLAQELGKRGHQIQVQDVKTSPRLKRNPKSPEQPQPVLKDATFVLAKHPDSPVLLTSSTIDGYGRAALLEEWETVKEKDLLYQVLSEGPPRGESFDIDMMLWFNGWVTLFNAVHICLGDLYRDGMEKIMVRQRKDPLTRALHRFDRKLLDYYAEVRDDLDNKIDAATGPHHLFHALTEEAEVRLHMPRRLMENARAT